LLLSPVGGAAQTPAPPMYGPPITLAAAQKALAGAEAEATKNNCTMVFVVVDSGARLVAFARMDAAPLGSIDIAMGKAITANNLRVPTKALQERIAQGGANLRLLAAPASRHSRAACRSWPTARSSAPSACRARRASKMPSAPWPAPLLRRPKHTRRLRRVRSAASNPFWRH
jgi:uncharacterized protein GlcG (DUF336 family)